MTYNLAHALADFAHLRNDMGIKRTDWFMLKFEVVGLMRKAVQVLARLYTRRTAYGRLSRKSRLWRRNGSQQESMSVRP
jgi:hypothetical protein